VAVATLLLLGLIVLQSASGQPALWTSINPVFERLNDVWMTSSNNGWAVGRDGRATRWDGTKWEEVLTPYTGTGAELFSVSCVSSSRCLAVGVSGGVPVLIQWDGTAWIDRSGLLAPFPGLAALYGIHTRSDGLTYAVGAGAPNIIRIPDANTLPVAVAAEASTGLDILYSVYVLPPGVSGSIQGFAVGDSGIGTGTTYRWDGSPGGWIYHSPGAGVGILRGVHMLNPTNALAAGDADVRTRWNGVSWTPEGGVVIAGTNWNAVFMVSSSDQWMVGNAVSGASSIARWTSSAWSAFAAPNVPTTVDLNSIFMLSGSEGWAVGDHGTIIQWNGSRWNSVTDPTRLQLHGVWLASTDDGWAVGASGGIFRRKDHYWNLYQTLPSGADLFDVHGPASNDAWAVGDDLDGGGANPPAVVRWNGASWTVVSAGVPTDAVLFAVFGSSSSFAMAAGRDSALNPVMIKWDGSSWGAIPSGLAGPARINSVWMLGSTDGFAVSSAGTIARWNVGGSNAWSSETSPVPTGLNDVFVVGSSCTATSCNAWAVGDNGIILHRDSIGWSQVASGIEGVGNDLRGIHMVSASEGWAVGVQDGSGMPFILFWNGVTWARVSPVPSVLNRDLNAVWMVGSVDGWAVGGTPGAPPRSVILRFGQMYIPVTTVTTSSATATATSTTTQSVTSTSTVATSTISTLVTSTSTLSGTTTSYFTTFSQTSTVTGTVTITPSIPIPGFPVESIVAGLIAGLTALAVVGKRQNKPSMK